LSNAGAARRMAFLTLGISVLISSSIPFHAGGLSHEDRSVQAILGSVSGQEMLSTVQDLQSMGSRAFYLDEADEAAAYVYARFSQLGLDVHYQNFTFGPYSSSNVVATIPGEEADAGTLLFGAHYDSENKDATNLSLAESLAAPGADDDASGVAAVIELADALRGARTRNTLKFLAFGAEERGYDHEGGLKGSAHFVATEVQAGERYEEAVLLDMIGYPGSEGNHCVVITNAPEDGYGQAVSRAVAAWDLDLRVEVQVKPIITYSDHSSFWSAGYAAVLVTEQLSESGHPSNPYYHTPADTANKLSVSQMENITRSLLAAALDMVQPSEGFMETQTVIAVAAMTVLVSGAVAATIVLYSRRKKGSERT